MTYYYQRTLMAGVLGFATPVIIAKFNKDPLHLVDYNFIINPIVGGWTGTMAGLYIAGFLEHIAVIEDGLSVICASSVLGAASGVLYAAAGNLKEFAQTTPNIINLCIISMVLVGAAAAEPVKESQDIQYLGCNVTDTLEMI